MRRIAVVNHQGGSGKTTTIVNTAVALTDFGQRVLVIDLDPQAAATSWLGVRDAPLTVREVLLGANTLADVIRPTATEDVDIVPASRDLWQLEESLGTVHGACAMLAAAIDVLPQRQWDVLLIDSPPSMGLLTKSAMAAVTDLLVPCEASRLSPPGIVGLMQPIDAARVSLNARVALSGILVCRFDKRASQTNDALEELRAQFGSLVFETIIRESLKLKECPSQNLPISAFSPTSAGTKDYQTFAYELLGRLCQGQSVIRWTWTDDNAA